MVFLIILLIVCDKGNIMEKIPSQPKENSPLKDRISGSNKGDIYYANLAKKSEDINNYGDAYHYWLAASSEELKDADKREKYQKNADKCLEKWSKIYLKR